MSARPWDYADRAAWRIVKQQRERSREHGVPPPPRPDRVRALRRELSAIIREDVRAEAAAAFARFATQARSRGQIFR